MNGPLRNLQHPAQLLSVASLKKTLGYQAQSGIHHVVYILLKFQSRKVTVPKDLMHPSLAPHLHEDCLDLIEQLHSCHTDVSCFNSKS